MELIEIFRSALKGDPSTLDKLNPYLESEEISYDNLEASLIHGFILNRLGKFAEARESLKVLKRYYSHIEQSFYRNNHLNEREREIFSLYLLVKAFRNIKLGFLDEGEILLEHSSSIIPSITDKWLRTVFLGIYNNVMGLSYWKMGKYDQSIKFHDIAISILSEPVYEILGIAYNDQAISYYEIGNYRESLQVLQLALPILKEYNSIQDYGYAIGNIGRVYRAIGDIVKAKKFAIESLKIKEMVGNFLDIAVEYRNLAMLAIYEENFDEAHSYLSRSLKFRLKMDNPIEIADSYYHLILLAFEWDNTTVLSNEKIQVYMQELCDYTKKTNHKLIVNQYRLAKALVLKFDRIEPTDKDRANEILRELVAEKEIQSEVRFKALIQVCGLMVENLKEERNQEEIGELQGNLDILMNHAKTNHLYVLMIQVLILKARFWLVQNALDKTYLVLKEAENLSHNKGLIALQNKVELEFELYKKYKNAENNITDHSLALDEVDNYLKSISTGLNMQS